MLERFTKGHVEQPGQSSPAVEQSKAGQYAIQKGWNYRVSNGQLNIEVCPVCGKNNFHCYMAYQGNKDGLWECKKCQEGGTLYELMVKLGDRDPNMQSSKEWADRDKKPDPLPNAEAFHALLLTEQGNAAMDYLTDVRGFSLDVIVKAKLGYKPTGVYFRELSREAPAIVIPYFKKGRVVFAKYRSFPPSDKAFAAPAGWEVPLYNEEILDQEGLPDITFVEGEYDALAAETGGIERVLGVPGAGNKKMLWVDLIDKAAPGKIYICYDRDPQGQKGAQDLAERIGVERCYNIILPDFSWEDDDGTVHKGKDISDWLRYGGGDAEKFEELKRSARKFDVKGVRATMDVLEELERNLEGKEFERAKYQTRFESINQKAGGFEPGDVVDILAPAKIGKTTFAIAIVDDLVADYGENAMMICGEMTPARMVRKWVCKVTETDDSPAIGDDAAREKAKRMRAAIARAKDIIRERPGEWYFCNPDIRDLDDLYTLMENAWRRYGIRFFIVDNMQLFCDATLRNAAHRTVHMSQFSKRIVKQNKQQETVLFRIVQPKKMLPGSIASQDDIDGASQIDKDCDHMWSLHRNRKAEIKAHDFEATGSIMDEIESFEPHMLVSMRLGRYAPGGKTTVMYNGGMSRIEEIDRIKDKVAEAAARPKNGDLIMEGSPHPSAAVPEIEQEVVTI